MELSRQPWASIIAVTGNKWGVVLMTKHKLLAKKVFGLLAAYLAVMSGGLAATTTLNYESPPTLMARDVLSAWLLRSENHRVLDEIQYEGYFFQFELEVDDGTELVTSKALLKIRVHEAAAVAEASNAMLLQTKVPASGSGTQPSEQDYMSARSSSARGDLVGEVPFSQIRLSGKKKTSPDTPAKAGSMGVPDSVSATGSSQGLDAHKRAVAARLQLDVYTSNAVAQGLLDQLALARVKGKAPLGAGFFIERDPETKLARGLVDAEVRRALKDNTPGELRGMNDQILATLAIPAEVRQRFLDHPAFTPRHRTFITAYLKQMGTVESGESLLLAALSAENEIQALFFEQLARMLAIYNEQVEALAKLSLAGLTVTAHTRTGTLVVAQPVDIVYWSEYFDLLTHSIDGLPEASASPGRELIVTGMFTDRARRELQGRGFTVRDRFLVGR